MHQVNLMHRWPLDVHGVIRRLKQATQTKSEAALSRTLGVGKYVVTQNKNRGTVPYLIIVRYCARYGLSLDTILLGAPAPKQKEGSCQASL